ncbi:unnamed protein product [Ectocarpus sp. CCAP 1310/34]|nr:unnamed protein product [Ectocarpus sp. CCAP 1310/34]
MWFHPYYLYGDPAYGISNHLICPFSASSVGPLTPEMADFNKRMSACRVIWHSCLNGGNEISQYFGVAPPSFEKYLGV